MKKKTQDEIAILVQQYLAGDRAPHQILEDISVLVTNDDGIAEVGDVVQISPELDSKFPGCFMVVTEVRWWGVQGYIELPGELRGKAYFRCELKNYAVIGRTKWETEG